MKYKILCILFLIIGHSFAQNKNQSMGFKENKGQIIDQKGKPNPDVKYLLNTNGLNVQIKTNGFSYDIYETKKHPLTEKQKTKLRPSMHPQNDKEKTPDYSLEYIYHRIDIEFVNSNPKVELITAEKSRDYDNYYNIPNKPAGVLMVHQYQQITYKNIYPNIDIVFSIPKDSLKAVEYNFVVYPKGKISDIQLKFNGAKTDLVGNKIKMLVRFGEMEETLPMSWTEDGKYKKEIAVGYTKIKNNVYGFASSENVSNKTVIIDPVPTRLWGTYYGGSQTDYIIEANNDLSGNLLITGNTFSRNNFTTSGAFITNHYSTQPSSFEPDGYIAKFDANGYRIWGTYLNAVPNDIDVDCDNNIISSGYAYNFNTIGTLGTHKPNKQLYNFDGYVLKLDPNGSRKWGTFYGDTGEDVIYSAVIDSNNNIIVTGYTGSIINIATPGTHKATKIDYSSDVFLAKIGPDGLRIWGTYYGGSSDDKALSIAIDENNNAYIVGETFSTDGIAFGSSNQNYLNTNSIDGFIASFDSQGKIIYGTYHGGDKNDYFNKIDYNNQKLLVSGRTFSTSNIATINAPQPIPPNTINSYSAGLFSIFNKNGTLEMGSYFEDVILDSGFDKDGNIFISGITSKTGIGTSNAYQQNLFNNYTVDYFIVKYKSNYVKDWGTYYGGRDLEFESIIHIDRLNGYIYIAGRTLSDSTLASNNAYQPLINGREDLYIAKFKDCLSSTTASSNSPICIGKTLQLQASGGTNYSWTGPNGFTSTEQNPTILNATAVNSGQYSCAITGTGDCDDTKTVDVIVGDTVAPIPNLTILPTITGDCNTKITTIPTATDACAGTITAATTSPLSYSLPGTYTIVWNYDDGNGNSVNQNQTVSINSQPLPTTTSPQTFCIQPNATLSSIAITGQNIKWYDDMTNGNLLANTTLLQNEITYYASQTINGCESERVPVIINIQNTLAPTGNSIQTFCASQNPTLATISVTGTAIKWYDALTNGSLLAETMNLVDGQTYYASQTVNNCESERFRVNVSIVNTPAAPIANATESFCKKENATLNNIQITGQNIKWYDTNSALASLPISTLLENNKTYYTSQTIGCESNRTPILVRVYDTPLPIASNNQQFCLDENATIANLTITASNSKWYDASINGNILAQTTLLQNNKTYYATQTLNNCESERLAITVKIQDTQNPIANSLQTFCIQKNAKISDIAISGQNINWFKSASSTIILSESTLLENGITYYASKTINNCESDRIPVIITILEATSEDCISFVDELPYPKFFTPNNDGYNDTWTIDFAYLAPNTEIKIFDRYGKLIKTLISNTSKWNGTFNGSLLPASDYWFVAIRANGAEYKGHFSLKR
jgi:gliding motility-associated-like protein